MGYHSEFEFNQMDQRFCEAEDRREENKMKREPVTGGAGRRPIYDCNGQRIHVGDKLKAQICVGPYGQTRIVETVVTQAHWPYCSLSVQGGCIGTDYDHDAKVLRCKHTHHDFEHGHETWAEVI